MVEIAKTVSREVKFLILDEPSAPLTPPEIESMFAVLYRLKQKGVTILYISHRIEEIFQITDRVTVLRDGLYISTLNTAETNRGELIRLMVGRELSGSYPQRATEPGGVVLSVKNLNSDYVKDVSFDLREGEILGLGGLVGAGRTETARAIFGADTLTGGEIVLNGEPIRVKNPKEAIKHGIGLIPEDRKRHGVLQGLSVKANVTFACLPVLSKRQWIESGKENGVVREQIANLQIKTPSDSQLVKNLSGGNQQKVVLAKWLATKCDVLIFDEPTRGIDVGAKQEIYKLMRSLAEQGKSIIMISSEMPELLGMSDRIVVMHEGQVMGELNPRDASQETVLAMASNL
jgi:ribose transport system ATP-binding protein